MYQCDRIVHQETFAWMLSEYSSILKVSGEGADSSVSDWEFIGCAVKAMFCELQLLRLGGKLNILPGHEAWTCMCTMAFQKELKDDFNNHEIVVNESYAHVQHNGVLKTDFEFQMAKMLKRVKAAKKLAQQANNIKDNKNTTATSL